ncbi:Signal transduction histidine kinase [Dyadobacter koreensis]|uniref:histidine kinase n=1 Tax=Dyadobacter koreensis TaxID=408657 RepID=A0A1H6VJ02_9BACT|nr:two-component regulator propeller domain-containing protein [Dyadobacter koreensis]SEJ02934.1 Signal transduction histidine kinase [Dyadobacter koreensis]
MKIWTLLLWGIIFVFDLKGQVLSETSSNVSVEEGLIFSRYGSADGLPDNRVRSFLQDSQGFLWIGTMNGLARYDGYSFRKFYKNKNLLPGNWINDLCEDKSGLIWIATREGLGCYDPLTESFRSYKHDPKNSTTLFSYQVNTVMVDVLQKLWIGTPQGVAVYNLATHHFTTLSSFPFNQPVRKIIRSEGNFLWIATDAGPIRYNAKTGAYKFYPFQAKPNAYGDRYWSMIESEKNLYLSTGGNGLLRLPYLPDIKEYGTMQTIQAGGGLKDKQIFDLCRSGDGSFWLATDDGLAHLENPDKPSATLKWYRNNSRNVQSLSNDMVYRLLIDKTQVLWCGTESEISQLDLSLLPFRHYTFRSAPMADQVRSIAAGSDQTIWLGMGKSGLYRHSSANGQTTGYKIKPSLPFWNEHRSLLTNREGKLWAGTLGGAFYQENQPFIPDILEGKAVFCMLEDTDGGVYFGTNHGLFYQKTNGKIRSVSLGLKGADFVRSLHRDHRGYIWVGFDNAGLGRLDPDSGLFIRLSATGNNLLGNAIYALAEFPANVIWAGSESGLHQLTTDRSGQFLLKTFTEKQGLRHPSVNSIQIDQNGYLWIGTLKGLQRFDPRSGSFRTYLTTPAISYNATANLSGRELLIGLSNGFLRFNPLDLKHVNSPPAVRLTDFRLFNESVGINDVSNGDTILTRSLPYTREITLNYKNNDFTLGFTALHYTNPQGNVFAYQMEGFDAGWINVDAEHRWATYTNLNPGTYYFKVRAANSFGEWNTHPTVLRINILPPPWKTWWAIIIYVLLFNGLLFVVIRYLLIQARQRDALALEQSEKQQLKTLHKLKVDFYTDISHEFRTPLTLMSGPIEDLMTDPQIQGNTREKVGFLQRNSRKLLELIDELMTFEKLDQGQLRLRIKQQDVSAFVSETAKDFELLAKRKGIGFELKLPSVPVVASFDTKQMQKVLGNLLSNALKFTPPYGLVTVKVKTSGNEDVADGVYIEVQDTGKGMSPEEISQLFERFYQSESSQGGTGIGLALSKKLVELHGGHISVRSTPNQLTCFEVWLPLAARDTANQDFSTPVIAETPDDAALQIVPDSETQLAEILLVDDNEEILDFLETIFNGHYQTRRAVNGSDALIKIKEAEPRLVISDVMMPLLNGMELCKQMKHDLATCHIPLILLTARVGVETEIEGLDLGADAYLAKPFHPEVLRALVRSMLENRQRMIQRYEKSDEIIPQDLARNPLDEEFLKKVIAGIESNLSNDEFSVEELSKYVCMSRSNLFRKLKGLTDQTPLEFIYFIRLKHAREMLLERKHSIADITYEVGFKNPSSFSKSFRKQFGKAPTDYLLDLVARQKAESLQ